MQSGSTLAEETMEIVEEIEWLDRSIFHLAPGLAASDQRLPVQIAVAEGLKQVTLWIDARAVQAFAASPYTYWWQLAPGPHTLRATALNAQGETISSETITIEVK